MARGRSCLETAAVRWCDQGTRGSIKSVGVPKMATDKAEVQRKIAQLCKKIDSFGLSDEDVYRVSSVRKLSGRRVTCAGILCATAAVLAVIVAAVAIGLGTGLIHPMVRKKLTEHLFTFLNGDIKKKYCIFPLLPELQDPFRPPVNCQICADIREVDRVRNLKPDEFIARHAYTARPVIVEDGAQNWTASEYFSFGYFKSVYKPDSPALLNEEDNCQFFPYKTNFASLGDVFNMSEERANLEDGSEPWYIGWSNCDPTAANDLRRHYERPYFLPAEVESSKTDWIFMGSPGYGAHLHIDAVGTPSWQAQVKGTKEWTLEPPPECYFECPHTLKVTVHPGEIIVLDTNKWFHKTLIIGDEMSITIGSEYD
ncbi:Hypp4129 [Branchiostoma lanceolatum]|uniref:Hypp4129 protein n=1 Tax=Branchiostoma lanceolatum TaxID=7740 RepID=A0A8K0A607_BRALA|nr:Hypp4129 [Branchiostoma lanceolatum]CAH1269250.1 Hypp4129 [Branchiostoma lanceolatum]CAH1269251.1 Hypp4129 [Branchiostoma lanceolatum]